MSHHKSPQERLLIVNESLYGIAGLLKTGQCDICFKGEEIYGLGVLIESLSDEMRDVQEALLQIDAK